MSESGIFDGIPEDIYHADTESLSASGAKVLLKNPARFRWERDNPPPPRDVFDLGTAAHTMILGVGAHPVPVDANDWRTKAAQAERDEIRAKGGVPLLMKDYEVVVGMHDAVFAHPLASRIFAPLTGMPEQSLYWHDDATGVRLRGRIDWLRERHIVDLKTTRNGRPEDFERDAGNLGYHISAAHYVEGVERLTGERLPFVIVAVEKEPPHFVSVHQFDDDFLAIGAARMREAIDLYAACEAADDWPAYGDDIHTLSPPRWLRIPQEF